MNLEQCLRLYRRLLVLQMAPIQAMNYVCQTADYGPKQTATLRGRLEKESPGL